MAKLPTVDLTEPVTRYFVYVQRTIDLNRDLAVTRAALVASLSGVVRYASVLEWRLALGGCSFPDRSSLFDPRRCQGAAAGPMAAG